MRAASFQHSSYTQPPSLRRRGVALVLAIAAHVLLMIMLFRLAPYQPLSKPNPKPATFQLLPQPRIEGARARAKRASGRAAPAKAGPKPPPRPPARSNAPLNMMVLSEDEYAASDISRLPSHREDRGTEIADAGAAGAGTGKGSGEGPGGERLYEGDWYRRPTDAEMSTYLPRTTPPGWGRIVCQTAARYHVDNCREWGESPPGSGLARAVRQAAWQFLIRPPSINGQPIIGAWVAIPSTTASAATFRHDKDCSPRSG